MIVKTPYASYTVVDASGSASKMRLSILPGLEAVPMMGAADNLRLLLSSLSNGVITRQSITFPRVEPFPIAATPGITADRVGVFVFATSTLGQYAVIDVPGIRDSCILSSGQNAGIAIDVLNPDIVTFIDAITSQLWCSVFGYDITSLVGTIVERRA